MNINETYALEGYSRWDRCNGESVYNPYVTTRTYTGTKVGVKNPFWRDQIRQERNATTPYQRTGVRLIEWKPYTVTRRLTKDCRLAPASAFMFRKWHGSHVGLPTIEATMSDTEAMNKAIMQFVDDHNKQSTSLLGGVYLKEWRQVRDMIKNPAKALWKEVHRYHHAANERVRRAKPPDKAAVLSDLWLEYSFGWVPLISDTRTAAEAAAKILEKDYGRYVIRGYGRTENLVSETFRNWAPTGAPPCGRVHEVTKSSNIVVIKGGLKPAVSGPSVAVHSLRQVGFTPNSFVPTIWECIPYSFLADYFVNVGDIIGATFHSWGDLTWASMARVGNTHFVSSMCPIVPQETDYSWSVNPGKLMITATNFTRTAPTNLVPKLAFQLPGQSTQWMNLAALAKLKLLS